MTLAEPNLRSHYYIHVSIATYIFNLLLLISSILIMHMRLHTHGIGQHSQPLLYQLTSPHHNAIQLTITTLCYSCYSLSHSHSRLSSNLITYSAHYYILLYLLLIFTQHQPSHHLYPFTLLLSPHIPLANYLSVCQYLCRPHPSTST